MSAHSPGVVRRTLSRLATSAKEHEAAELREGCVHAGATLVADLPAREQVVVAGTLRTVTLRPRGGVPAIEAELYDGSGLITVIWLGRRRISGIEPGRHIKVDGRIGFQDKHRVIFNPRYELQHP